jgi:hypothetical protein
VGHELPEPSEGESIDCHLQQVGMGTLLCRAAKPTGDHTTNEVSPAICYNCDVGKIYREVGCDAVLPKVRIHQYMGGADLDVAALLCRIRKRETTLDHCRTCGLANAETTRQIVQTARGLFTAQGFHGAYKDVEKAREGIRDGDFSGAITNSASCLESVLRECHVRLGQPLPAKKQVSDLWKSARALLKLDEIDGAEPTVALLNTLAGVTTNLGSLRNALGDAHGRDSRSPAASEMIAELAVNTAATLATVAIRRLNQLSQQASNG